MSENQLLEVIERYLNGEMTIEELRKFELLRKESAEVDGKVVEHQLFTNLLKQYGERVELENRLNAIHAEIDVHTLKEELTEHPVWIVQMWRHHHSKISVAVSVAMFVFLGVLAFSGKFDNNDSKIERLKYENAKLNQKVVNINKSVNDIKAGKNVVINDRASSTGTGFALPDGLIATNYHVIQDADSIYIQNNAGSSFKARVLYTEPEHDIAILRVVDDSFSLGAIPYTFKKSEIDEAESIYTYGYPSGIPKYDIGYLASKTGLNGDSVHYQVAIPTNPGNSGSPVWDNKGNIVAIIDAAQSRYEGTHFAIKSRYLLDAIRNIPADSLKGKPVTLNKKNGLAGLSIVEKTRKMKKYTFMVKVYN